MSDRYALPPTTVRGCSYKQMQTHYSLSHPCHQLQFVGAVTSKCRHTTVCGAPTTVWVQSQAKADTLQFVSHPCHPLQFGCGHKQMQTHYSLCRTPATHYSLCAVTSKCRHTTVCVASLPPTTVCGCSHKQMQTHYSLCCTPATHYSLWVQSKSNAGALQFVGTVTIKCRHTTVCVAPLKVHHCRLQLILARVLNVQELLMLMPMPAATVGQASCHQ